MTIKLFVPFQSDEGFDYEGAYLMKVIPETYLMKVITETCRAH